MTATATKSTRRTTKPAKESRTVTVLKRAEIKRASDTYNVQPGDVVNIVKSNDNGHVHTTTLRRNKQHTCTCEGNAKWHKECFHIKHCVSTENARWQAERDEVERIAAEARQIEETRITAEAQLVEAGEVATAARVAEQAEKVRKGIDMTRRAEDEAAVSKILITLSEVRERKAKEAAKGSSKSAEQIREEAPLNNRNSGFSLMR